MGRLGGCVQFQDGTPEDVERYVELNFTFSIGSSVTYPDPGGWHDTVATIPDDALLLETDAPWLPYDGSRARAQRAGRPDAPIGETVARHPRHRPPSAVVATATPRTCAARCPAIG